MILSKIIELQINFVDFVVYDILDLLKLLEPTILDGCDKLQAFIRRFEVWCPTFAYS